MKRSGKAPLELHGDGLAPQVAGIEHRIAHLGVVLERHLRDGLGVRAVAAPRIRVNSACHSAWACSRLIEHHAVLERRIHALPVERAQSHARHPPAAAPCRRHARARHARCPSCPCGCVANCASSAGISASTSGNSRLEELSHSCRGAQRGEAGAARRGRNSVAVKLPSVLGNAMSMKPPRGQTCSACGSSTWRAASARQGQFLVVVIEPVFAHLRESARAQGSCAAPSLRRRLRSWAPARLRAASGRLRRRGSAAAQRPASPPSTAD